MWPTAHTLSLPLTHTHPGRPPRRPRAVEVIGSQQHFRPRTTTRRRVERRTVVFLSTPLSHKHTLSHCQESVLAEAKEFAPCLAVDPAVLTRANIKKYTGLHNCCPHCTPSSKVDHSLTAASTELSHTHSAYTFARFVSCAIK